MLVCLILAIIVVVAIVKYRKYKECAYYQVTGNSPLQVYFDKGKLGEYMTYKYLQRAENGGAKFLFNIYIPKGENETTEIDVLMIHSKGLFVFESKNYSGWIFGSEYQKNWYQTLPQGRGRSHKESFYNPIMQNRTHIKHLKAMVGENVPMYSIITFSERCTLKKVEVKSQDIRVINRYDVQNTVAAICGQVQDTLLSESQIKEIYDKLYPYTQVDAAVRAQHIANIEKKLETVPMQPAAVQEETQPEPELVAETIQDQEKKCPRCGGTLVLRTASRGANAGNQFYGCANYPKCRFVQKLTEKTNDEGNLHAD